MKFAQRAKYIRNNAIINEDASGDVLSMRLQIQSLKKEVSRLQGLVGSDRNQGVGSHGFICVSPSILNGIKVMAHSLHLLLIKRLHRGMIAMLSLLLLLGENKRRKHN